MTFSDAKQKSKIELTQQEMLEISQEISRKFAPMTSSFAVDSIELPLDHGTVYSRRQTGKNGKNTILHLGQNSQSGISSKELYEISQDISKQFMPDVSTTLPELFILPVDPYHLYAYWDFGEKKRYLTRQEASGNCLVLRIYWRPDENTDITSSNVWFDLAVHDLEARQKVRLPIDGTAYSAALGKLDPDNNFDIYAFSNIIRVPPSKMRVAPSLSGDQSALHETNSKAMLSAQEKAHFAATEFIDETSLMEAELTDILYENRSGESPLPETGWFAKFHFSDPAAHHNDNAKINSRLMQLLNQKGISIQLLPEPFFLEVSHFRSKNASGQGI